MHQRGVGDGNAVRERPFTEEQLDERRLDLRSQEGHGEKGRLPFDQASPTCIFHEWNRPGFRCGGRHARLQSHCAGSGLCWPFSAPILAIHPSRVPPIAAASDMCGATVAATVHVSAHDDACGNESSLSSGLISEMNECGERTPFLKPSVAA